MDPSHIEFNCRCGARIRMPASAADKQARCKTCAAIFTVPALKAATAASDHWLAEFANQEAHAAGPRRVVVIEPTARTPEIEQVSRDEGETSDASYADRDWITPAQKPFWLDLALSFVFFAYPDNLVPFASVVFISLWGGMASIAPFIGTIASALINGFLCAFYLGTIRETAAGEDDLPTPMVSNIMDDILVPLCQFIGATLFTLAPYIAFTIVLRCVHAAVSWQTDLVVLAICLFFWPAMMLALSLGGSLSGLRPDMAVRTVLAAPHGYVVLVAVVLAAGVVGAPLTGSAGFFVWLVHLMCGLPIGDGPWWPNDTLFMNWLNTLAPAPSTKAAIGFVLLEQVLSVYAAIVTMRVIGLYYRHFKKRFPWSAE